VKMESGWQMLPPLLLLLFWASVLLLLLLFLASLLLLLRSRPSWVWLALPLQRLVGLVRGACPQPMAPWMSVLPR